MTEQSIRQAKCDDQGCAVWLKSRVSDGGLHMRFMAAAILLALVACAQSPSRAVMSCVSDSGQSQFLIDLDAATGRGALRYQFFGQDVFYSSGDVRADGAKLVGTGQFLKSLTGETRGSSFGFEYDSRANTFIDGAVTYKCENLQDRSLIAVPGSQVTDGALPR